MTPTIRPAPLADIPAITRIYAHAVTYGTASFELEPPTEAEMAKRMQALLDGRFPYFIAEIGGTVAGYAYASLYRTRPAYRFTVEDSVYVAPEIHRRGIRQMIAVIGDSSKQAASVGLHAALGLRHVGILQDVGFKHGRWVNTLLMQRELGRGSTVEP